MEANKILLDLRTRNGLTQEEVRYMLTPMP